jgi:hypothetical protein
MTTTPLLNITELDFFRAKNQLKEFLRNDPSGRFRDIDYEGSNISVLLDVLAYNTYQNNFYTNMAISEMFLDSAQLENSVVSHAKELNYLPKSATSARALVNITILGQENTDATIVIPANTRFTTNQGPNRYNFYTKDQYLARRSGLNYVAENVELFEGEIVDEAFFVTEGRKSIRLLNQNIDIDSIRVFENFEQPLDRIEYVFRKDIFGVSPTDPVYYLQPAFDGTYEVTFGSNRFGKEPPINSQVRVFYRITNGEEANGACRFTTSFVANASVITIDNATGGAQKETLTDIKNFAPKSIQVQERAVTGRDYEILLKQRFNEIQDVSVYGGDELEPPRFGKVAISVNVDGGISDILIAKYTTFLRDKTPIGIQPIFLSPEFMNVQAAINISYSSRNTRKTKSQIEGEVRELLQSYADENLGKFGSIFEVSRVSTLIDSLDLSIRNTTIDASPYILYSPEFNRIDNPVFTFGLPLQSPCRFARAAGTPSFNSFIRSSTFIYEGTEALFEDNGLGAINIVNARDRARGVFEFLRLNAGTVDYETGIAKLSNFIVDSYTGNGIRVAANTQEKNVTAPKSNVLLLNDDDIEIIIEESPER